MLNKKRQQREVDMQNKCASSEVKIYVLRWKMNGNAMMERQPLLSLNYQRDIKHYFLSATDKEKN
jgi:hypothetical protein